MRCSHPFAKRGAIPSPELLPRVAVLGRFTSGRVMHPPLLADWSPSSQATIQVVRVQPAGMEEDNAKQFDLVRSRSGHAPFRIS